MQLEEIKTKIEEASDLFDASFPTYNEKIDLLSIVKNDKNFAENCDQSAVIYKAIKMLGENAQEVEPRRIQQRLLGELVKFIQSQPSKEELEKFFMENNMLFNVFCLMVIHFNDEALSEREKQAHAFMTPNFMLAVQKLTQN